MSQQDEWTEAQRDNGWVMPTAPLWKRLPIIRHVRALPTSGSGYGNGYGSGDGYPGSTS